MCRYFPAIYYNTKSLFLLILIVIFITLALRISGSLLGIPLNQAQVGYLGVLWIVTAGMLISVLLNMELAYIIVTLMSIVLSLTLNGEVRVAASAILISYVGIYSVDNIRDRHDLWRAMAILAATGVVLIWILGGLGSDSISQMLTGTVWAVVNGVLAGCFFWIGTWLLERPFDTITHMSLLELADPNRPLLRRLLMEAPGTYTHSMAVGHLAETGAEAIGADSLLARVASYYHDIGKLRRPHFFTENQNVENVHDRMNPTLSALVITSHIKDGYDIAKEAKLPRVILDFISQHHGISLVQYFYHQAAGEQDPSNSS